MRESFTVRFESAGKRLNILQFDPALGVVFDTHPDASPLNIAIGIQPRLPGVLEPVRKRHDWRKGEFKLDVVPDGGGLRFSGAGGDPKGLPTGLYDLTVEVESYDFEDSAQTLEIPQGGRAELAFREKRDPRRLKLRNNIDSMTANLIGAGSRSRIDGLPVLEWLVDAKPRECRKACLLNVLAKLRVPPAPSAGLPDPLTGFLDFLFFADVDRVYAAARPQLNDVLARLVAQKLWVKEGRPQAAIHERLLGSLPRLGVDPAAAKRFRLTSFRQGGRNCLQIVTATPPESFPEPTVYADIDIDLGNPLWDLQGLCIHLSEVLDSGRTNHFSLHDRLDKGDTRDFLYYDLVAAADASA